MENLKTLEEKLSEAKRKVSVYDILPPDGKGVIAYDKDGNDYKAYWDSDSQEWKSVEKKKLPDIISYSFY